MTKTCTKCIFEACCNLQVSVKLLSSALTSSSLRRWISASFDVTTAAVAQLVGTLPVRSNKPKWLEFNKVWKEIGDFVLSYLLFRTKTIWSYVASIILFWNQIYFSHWGSNQDWPWYLSVNSILGFELYIISLLCLKYLRSLLCFSYF